MENELTGHKTHFQSTIEDGNDLRSSGHYAAKAIGTKIAGLQDKWKKLNELAATRRARLEEAVQIQQVCRQDIAGCGVGRPLVVCMLSMKGRKNAILKKYCRDVRRQKYFCHYIQ